MINTKSEKIQRALIRGLCIDLRYRFEYEDGIFILYKNERDKIHGKIMFQGNFKEVINILHSQYKRPSLN